MRALLIKNNGQKVIAVTEWDGHSHINVPRAHTLVLSDDKTVAEGMTVKISDLKAQEVKDDQRRAAEQAQAEKDSKARRLAKARAIVGPDKSQSGENNEGAGATARTA
jgi:hypothetical protein